MKYVKCRIAMTAYSKIDELNSHTKRNAVIYAQYFYSGLFEIDATNVNVNGLLKAPSQSNRTSVRRKGRLIDVL